MPRAMEAFEQAMTVADISTYGRWIVPTSEDAVMYFNKLVEKGFNGIILFPYAGIDYTECMRAAAQANIAVHVILADTPYGIFNEICALYDIENAVLRLDGNTPWPQGKDATILVFYRESDVQGEDAADAVNDAFIKVDYDFDAGHLFSTTAKKENAARTLEKYLSSGLGEGFPALEAVCVFPYEDVDYTAAIEKANEMGVALHFVDTAQPDDIVKNICDLYEDVVS